MEYILKKQENKIIYLESGMDKMSRPYHNYPK